MSNKRIFTKEEEKFIVDNWGKVSCHKMRDILNCSHEALVRVANQYDLELPKKPWTEEEIHLLRKLAPLKSVEEIAKAVGKSKNAVLLKASRLGIIISYTKREWTEEEESLLRRLWGTTRIENIARRMKRSVPSIKVRATKLKLGPMYGNDARYLTISMISEL